MSNTRRWSSRHLMHFVFLSDVRWRLSGRERREDKARRKMHQDRHPCYRIVKRFISSVSFACVCMCEFVCSRHDLKERWEKKEERVFFQFEGIKE